MRRLLPYPLMTLSFLLLWLLLVGSLAPRSILLGALLAILGGWTLRALGAPKGHVRRMLRVPALLWDVLVEIIRSNNAVARIILTPGDDGRRRAGFVRVPLDMRSPYGLAALACILTATPGTAWVEYDSSDGVMLLHVLDLIDGDDWARIVKQRWERRLMEIFE